MRIAIIAGELSGDQLGGPLVKLLKKQYPNAIIEGIAGPKMQEEGCYSLHSMDILSVMGIFEVIKHLPKILRVRREVIRYFTKNKPDIFIGIDAPDFNLHVEKKLKQQGVKTIHYVSPSVWAWREGRIKKIKQATDTVLAILPFEEDFYAKHEHRAVFVGHPLATKIPLEINKLQAKKKLELSQDEPIVALLPGSRKQEVELLLPVILDACSLLKKKYNVACQFILPIAKATLQNTFNEHLDIIKELNINVIQQQSDMALAAADLAIVASGTATLEAMLYKTPMSVVYKVNGLTKIIYKFLLKIKYFSLPNILAEKPIINEFMQEQCTAENIAKDILDLHENTAQYDEIVNQFYFVT